MTGTPTRHADTLIFPASLDPHAVSVVNRLLDADLEAYLVGGCVRDLMLGLIPKDFDISTEARPRQIRRVFRNSRIIGRRFKLAHVHFGDKIIEVATFRRSPEGTGEPGVQVPDLLITRDNEFGNAEQDALRRDFTINALLYDVRSAEVIDYVGGVQDLKDRVLRTIGDPAVRFAEDPVRMLRAVKFMSRLGLTPAPDLDAAMRSSADTILRSAPPRVLEEIYKLMTCGRAGEGLDRLVDYGLMQRLLPEVAPYWENHRESLRALGAALDLVDRGRRAVSNTLLLAVLWERPWRAALEQADTETPAEPAAALHALLDPVALRMSIPRRDVAGVRHVFQTMLRMESGRRGRRGRMGDFLARSTTHEAVRMLHLLARADCIDPEVHAAWAERAALVEPTVDDSGDSGGAAGGGARGRRRGRRSGRRRGGRGGRGRRTRGSGSEKTEAAGPGADRPEGDDNREDASPTEGTAEGQRGRPTRRRGRRRRKGAPAREAASSPTGDGGESEAAASGETAGTGRREASPSSGAPTRRRARGGSRRKRREPSQDAPSRRDAGTTTGGSGSPLREHPEDVEDLFDW